MPFPFLPHNAGSSWGEMVPGGSVRRRLGQEQAWGTAEWRERMVGDVVGARRGPVAEGLHLVSGSGEAAGWRSEMTWLSLGNISCVRGRVKDQE